MATRSLLGLDIGSRFVKAIELTESRGGLTVTGWARGEVPSPEALPDVLREVLARGGFRAKQAATSVSGRNVVVRYIQHPRVTEEELPTSIRYEAGKYLPFDPDDCYLDFEKLEEPGSLPGGAAPADMRVLLVAARRPHVDDHVALLEKLGLEPAVVDVDALAVANAFEFRELANPAAGERVVALLDIGASKTCVTIARPGTSHLFSREVFVAGNEFTQAIAAKLNMPPSEAEVAKRLQADRLDEMKEAVTSLLEDVCHEVRLSFDYYEQQFERGVDDVFVSGGGSKTAGLGEVFERALEKKPQRWDPTEAIPIAAERVNVNDLKENAAQAAVAMGLASRIRRD
jgi:type IV pilus assembly protein PilM